MARSHCVYVVIDADVPVAGFTVKHELVSWLGRAVRDERVSDSVEVWRLEDGVYQSGSGTQITDEVLELTR